MKGIYIDFYKRVLSISTFIKGTLYTHYICMHPPPHTLYTHYICMHPPPHTLYTHYICMRPPPHTLYTHYICMHPPPHTLYTHYICMHPPPHTLYTHYLSVDQALYCASDLVKVLGHACILLLTWHALSSESTRALTFESC
jgi:hypothetical protein